MDIENTDPKKTIRPRSRKFETCRRDVKNQAV